jgi:hypothetical protein
MASDIELLERDVRRLLDEAKNLRYKRTTASAGGAADGTTVQTALTQLTNHWRGCAITVLSGDAEGAERTIESSSAAGLLSFTNNPFPIAIAASVEIEISEKGTWSGSDLKRWLIDSINFVAGVLPKSMLRTYLRKTTATTADDGSLRFGPLTLGDITEDETTLGDAADITLGDTGGTEGAGSAAELVRMLDIHYLTVNGKPAVSIPPERISRLISGRDAFLSSALNRRFFYHFRGRNSYSAEISIAPVVEAADVVLHYIPLMENFGSDGSTYFPKELWQPVVYDTVATSFEQNENIQLATLWRKKRDEWLVSRGVQLSGILKLARIARQEATK